jgi:tetratricopeptide (TPR) repeat protein
MLRRYDAACELANRYTARVPGFRILAELAIKSRYGRDGVSFGLLRALATLPARKGETERLIDAYNSALRQDDLKEAGKILSNPKLTVIPDEGEMILDPVALHRAMLAFLTGQEKAAKAAAEEALDYYRRSPWTPRQMPWVEMHIAWAEALAGRGDAALAQANKTFAALGSPENFDALWMRPQIAYVHLLLGRSDDALAVLKEMMARPCWPSPNEIRSDPLWAKLKGDPRFEQTLRAAKPL